MDDLNKARACKSLVDIFLNYTSLPVYKSNNSKPIPVYTKMQTSELEYNHTNTYI